MLRAVCTKILGKNLWKMSSLAETMKQLRSLNGLVEKLRAETRSFLEAKDREFVNVQNQIQMICSGLTEQSAVPLGNGQGGYKRPLEDTPNASANKRMMEEAKFSYVGTGSNQGRSKEAKFRIQPDDPVDPSTAFTVNHEGFTEVYTDGACPNNGKGGARAGVGVWWGAAHPLNYSRRATGDKQTNNVAEIQAGIVAIRQAVAARRTKLLIHTDSQFLISCVTQWMQGWKKKGWVTASGQPVKNKDDLLVLDKLIQENKGLQIRWNHVKGHSNVPGNEAADKLAVEGANMSSQW